MYVVFYLLFGSRNHHVTTNKVTLYTQREGFTHATLVSFVLATVFFTLDYLIVTISIVLEVVFHAKTDEIYQSLAGLLVLVRLWRFFRIGHGIVEVTHELAQEEYHKLEYYKDELEALLRSHNIALPAGAEPKVASSHASGGHPSARLPELLVAVEHHQHQSSIHPSTRNDSGGAAADDDVDTSRHGGGGGGRSNDAAAAVDGIERAS
jgi:hypothetical protein